MPDLILASTSPYRRALLERLGVPFRCLAPRVDEETWKGAGLTPRVLAERLAEAKALSLSADAPDAVILGGDQVVSLDDDILGKPGDRSRAVEQLSRMSGRSHDLITATAVWHAGRVMLHTDVTMLTMRRLTLPEIERYLDADRPFDCAGSYKLEARGITLFERIVSDDQTAVTGLPLIALTTTLRDLGFVIP